MTEESQALSLGGQSVAVAMEAKRADASKSEPLKHGSFYKAGGKLDELQTRPSFAELSTGFEILKGKRTKFLGIDDAIEMLSYIKTSLKTLKGDLLDHEKKAVEVIKEAAAANTERIEANRKKIDEDRDLLERESRAYCDQQVELLKDEINKVTSTLQTQINDSCGRLEAQFGQADRDISNEISRSMAKQDNLMCERLTERFEARIRDMMSRADDRDKALDAKMVHLYKETEQSLRKDSKAHEAKMQKAHAEFVEHVAQQDKRHTTVEKDLREILQKLDKSVAACVRRASDLVDIARSETSSSISKLNDDRERTYTSIQADFKRLRRSVAEVASSQTRRVEWVIKDALQHVQHHSRVDGDGQEMVKENKSYSSWFSPTFEAAGVYGLQLELRVARPEALPKADSYDCMLCLWGTAGLSLVCKLYVGGATVQLQHKFDGNTPCSTKSLCCWRDQVCQDDGALHVGVDVLEAIRQDEHVEDPAINDSIDQSQSKQRLPECTLVQHRYVNHRLLDLVQDQVDRMRSRMTRQIEWRIEQASSLPKYFPEGECMCSSTFEAAGITGLQLVFYPAGYSGAKEGFCSYFLFCPSGSILRCWLSAGKQRREARIAFDEPGFFGRTNFCRFDSCIDPSDDTVLLALEIEEAQQTTSQALTHQSSVAAFSQHSSTAALPADSGTDIPARATSARLSPRPPSTPRPLTTGMGRSPHSKAGSPAANKEPLPGIVDSMVKRHRTPGRVALEEVRQLPSIWTSKPVINISEVLDGFYSYRDIKTLKRPGATKSLGRGQTGNLTAPAHHEVATPAKGPAGQLLNVFSDATLSTCGTDADGPQQVFSMASIPATPKQPSMQTPRQVASMAGTPATPKYMMYAS